RCSRSGMSTFSLRDSPRKEKKSALRAEGASTAAGHLRVGVLEHESPGDEIRVVIQHRAIQVQQAFPVDVQFRPERSLEHLVAQTGLLLPRKDVAQSRTAAALDADAQPAIVDALAGHQGADLARGGFRDLNHDRELTAPLTTKDAKDTMDTTPRRNRTFHYGF